MALYFPLMVNDERIGQFVAQRREDVIPPDRVCTYDVTVELHGCTRTAVVRHDYDAGAFALVVSGLVAAGAAQHGGVRQGWELRGRHRDGTEFASPYGTEPRAERHLDWLRRVHPDVPVEKVALTASIAGPAGLAMDGRHCASCDGHSCPR